MSTPSMPEFFYVERTSIEHSLAPASILATMWGHNRTGWKQQMGQETPHFMFFTVSLSSLKYSCSWAALPDILRSGQYWRNLDMRSMPSASKVGVIDAQDWGSYTGKSGFQSGNSVIVGQVSAEGVPKILKIFCNWLASVSPGNRGFPFTISAKIHPTDQMSTGVEYLRLPISTSGALYHSVTTSCV